MFLVKTARIFPGHGVLLSLLSRFAGEIAQLLLAHAGLGGLATAKPAQFGAEISSLFLSLCWHILMISFVKRIGGQRSHFLGFLFSIPHHDVFCGSSKED